MKQALQQHVSLRRLAGQSGTVLSEQTEQGRHPWSVKPSLWIEPRIVLSVLYCSWQHLHPMYETPVLLLQRRTNMKRNYQVVPLRDRALKDFCRCNGLLFSPLLMGIIIFLLRNGPYFWAETFRQEITGRFFSLLFLTRHISVLWLEIVLFKYGIIFFSLIMLNIAIECSVILMD